MANSRVAGVFPLPDGESFVVAEWFPDPRQLEIDMLKMADAFDDWTVPLQAAREVMIESTRIHFETESDPYGDKWAPLVEHESRTGGKYGYAVEKSRAGFPDQILVRTGELERTATSEQAWFVAQDAIWFNAGALPSYGPIHQEGTQEGLKASILQATIETPPSQLSEEDVRTLQKGGRGLNLPQRMFVGATVDDIAEIEEIFLQHIGRTIEGPWRGIGGGGGIIQPVPGDIVTTSKGFTGILTSTPAFGGGFLVRGESGKFVPGTF